MHWTNILKIYVYINIFIIFPAAGTPEEVCRRYRTLLKSFKTYRSISKACVHVGVDRNTVAATAVIAEAIIAAEGVAELPPHQTNPCRLRCSLQALHWVQCPARGENWENEKGGWAAANQIPVQEMIRYLIGSSSILDLKFFWAVFCLLLFGWSCLCIINMCVCTVCTVTVIYLLLNNACLFCSPFLCWR